jgi:hypothetical protein
LDTTVALSPWDIFPIHAAHSVSLRSHLSDDKKHGLKELASLDLVTEGGQRGIDVSTARERLLPHLHVSAAVIPTYR